MFTGRKPVTETGIELVSVLIISNANAKKVAKSGSLLTPNLLPETTTHHHTRSPFDLIPVFEKSAESNLNHLVIEGGDGTVRTILSSLLNCYDKTQVLPAISILPRGTTNQIARNLGVKKPADLVSIFNDKFREISMPLIKIKSKNMEHRYGFLFSTGALPYVSRFTQDNINAKGVGGGTAVVGAVVKAVTSDKASLMPPAKHRLKGKTSHDLQTIINHKGLALGTIMTTLPTLMMGLDPFWGEENAPLRVTWAEAESAKLGRTVAGLWAGRKKNRVIDGYHSHNVDKLTLRTKAPATLDGDFLDIAGQKLKISASRPVTFWVKQ